MRAPRPHIHVGSATFYQGGARSQSEWEAATRRLLDEGHFFPAYDLATTGLKAYPDSLKLKQTRAQALIRTGALEQAREILEPLCAPFTPERETLARAYAALHRAVASAPGDGGQPPGDAIEAIQDLVTHFGLAGAGAEVSAIPDEETVGLLARLHKDIWRRTGRPEDARLARDTYLRAYRATGGIWTGINVAAMSWLLGERERAEAVAARVLERCREIQPEAEGDDRYWIPATIGEALLLLGREAEALEAYTEAAAAAGRSHRLIVSSVEQLRLLAGRGLPVPEALFDILKLPTLVLFAGHLIDAPGRPAPRFPVRLERAVREAIDRQLEALDARIGYCSAASGSDILFIEAMQDRGAEVNIVIPFDTEDFLDASVRPAGERWVCRFRKVVRSADTVTHVTSEPYLGTRSLFSFGAWVTQGCARLRAQSLQTSPYLLAVWNGQDTSLPGGTAETVLAWPDPERLRVVRIDQLGEGDVGATPSAGVPMRASYDSAGPAGEPSQREVRTMLFADIVGYSQLEAEAIPGYMRVFLHRVSECLGALPSKPLFTNTWGDAIFAVMERAMPLAEYALALRRVVCDTDWPAMGLPGRMSIRIALHAGPVFVGTDPITGRPNYYGPHVNRTARIEPITVAGQIYASEQFVSLLVLEQETREQEAKTRGGSFEPPFACDYVGTLALAKDFGEQSVYHVRERIARGVPSV